MIIRFEKYLDEEDSILLREIHLNEGMGIPFETREAGLLKI